MKLKCLSNQKKKVESLLKDMSDEAKAKTKAKRITRRKRNNSHKIGGKLLK